MHLAKCITALYRCFLCSVKFHPVVVVDWCIYLWSWDPDHLDQWDSLEVVLDFDMHHKSVHSCVLGTMFNFNMYLTYKSDKQSLAIHHHKQHYIDKMHERYNHSKQLFITIHPISFLRICLIKRFAICFLITHHSMLCLVGKGAHRVFCIHPNNVRFPKREGGIMLEIKLRRVLLVFKHRVINCKI